MGSPIGRYESDLKRYRSDARLRPWLDDSRFELEFCVRAAIEQIENMLQRNPTSVTEMRQMLNELSSIFARVTHAMTRTTKPGEEYCGPTNPHPRQLYPFIFPKTVQTGLTTMITDSRARDALRVSFITKVKPPLHQVTRVLPPPQYGVSRRVD